MKQNKCGVDHVARLSLQFQLSYSDKQRYEMEERPDAQKQILIEIAKKLPIFTRAQSGGKHYLCFLIVSADQVNHLVLFTQPVCAEGK